MHISEIPEGSKVIFEINIDNVSHEFKSKILETRSDFIIANPIRVDDKVLGFGSVPTNLIYCREDKSPIIWKQVAINIVLYKNNTVYKIEQSMEGVESNRRTSYRMYVGLTGNAQLGVHHKVSEVLVKDVSENGFSIICKEELDKEDRGNVRLTFEDMDRTIIINGVMVRSLKLEDGRFLYGCKITFKTPLVAYYISEKQRQMIARQKGVTLVGGTRSDYKKLEKVDKAEALVEENKPKPGKKQYSSDILKEKTVRIDKDRYRNIKF